MLAHNDVNYALTVHGVILNMIHVRPMAHLMEETSDSVVAMAVVIKLCITVLHGKTTVLYKFP